MSLKYIREYYKVPADLGRKVKVKAVDKFGVIIGSHDMYVIVRMARDSRGREFTFHPSDLEYLEMDENMRRLLEMIEREKRL